MCDKFFTSNKLIFLSSYNTKQYILLSGLESFTYFEIHIFKHHITYKALIYNFIKNKKAEDSKFTAFNLSENPNFAFGY
ncbi:hypothetical protein CNEO2_300012 [Clostridium neonatale]|nr:hypothetical protein CNEO2_1010012 [Clostridium neonatale]CAI3238679.1 hypothetical protein CNEO2_300012 [Clostridium neonatale]